MSIFSRLLGTLSSQAGCQAVVDLLLRGREMAEIHGELTSRGYFDRRAARLVAFVPSAFARAYYGPQGYGFPSYFYPGMDAYRAGKFRRYSDEPVFTVAADVARRLISDGDREIVEKVMSISAEHRGIEEAKRQGLTPTESSLIIYEF